jgi:hypothetical protein
MEILNLKKLNEVDGREQHQVKTSNRIVALEDLGDDLYISRAWETIRENIKISAKERLDYYELKYHKPWFHEEYSELSDKKKTIQIAMVNRNQSK